MTSFQTIPVVSKKNHGPTQPVQLHHGTGSTAPITVTSTSAQLPPPPEAEKVPFSLSSIKQVKNLVSKENTNITLASIGTDEVASHFNATTTQAFNVEMKKTVPTKNLMVVTQTWIMVLMTESQYSPMNDVVTPVTTEGDDAQATQI